MTPRQIVAELDKLIVGQDQAKPAVQIERDEKTELCQEQAAAFRC